MWDTAYSRQYINSVVQHALKVKFAIASHTHFNDFKVFYNNAETPVPVAFMRIVPSICSNHGNNPSFEVAEFSAATGRVVKETNHYLNLADVPKGNTDYALKWNDQLMTAGFLDGEINARNFSKEIDKVKNDRTWKTLGNYIKFYTVGTHIDSNYTINHANYMKYLQADSLKAK